MDTIFAQATAPGRAGIAVVRLSGPAAHDIAQGLAGDLPGAGRVGLRPLTGRDGEPIDQALVLRFTAPASFTGEDVVELHLHGSVAIVARVLEEIGATGRARLAEPGEFTRRALENDRLDLVQVEGLSDLIDAETEAQRKQAMRVFQGRLGELVEGWRAGLLRAAALIEATIDFADEEVPVDVGPEVTALLTSVGTALEAEIAASHVAERIRDGFEVAILGAPNAGKSTLLNAIAGRDVAITSEVAGTTRDVIEVRVDLGGLAVTFLDTAGLRATEDAVERIGVARARDRAAAADMRVFLLSSPGEVPDLEMGPDDLVIAGKADLHGRDGVSGKTGQGVSDLLSRVSEVLAGRAAGAATATRQRHRDAMRVAADALADAVAELDSGPDRAEFAAEHLREAARGLDSLIGRIDVEAVLGEIFARFCIGK